MLAPFESPKLLLARANGHIQDLERIEADFIRDNPYRLSRHVQLKTGVQFFKASVASLPPNEMAVDVFETVNCLRSALDHAVYDSVAAIGGDPKPKYTKFPFGKTLEDAKHDIARKGGSVPEVLHNYLLDFEPYEHGKNALWELNEVRNGKIHRLLDPAVISSGGVAFLGGNVGVMTVSTLNQWSSERRELTYMRVERGAQANVRIDVTVQISFGQETVFGQKRAVNVLNDAAKVVSSVVLGLEMETARIIEAG